MFERFTERARQVVVFAQEESRAAKHDCITLRHLLVGILREEEGLGARVLEGFDLTPALVRVKYEQPVLEHEVDGQIPFTEDTKSALELALREALSIGHNYIGTEHLLLGLVRRDPTMLEPWGVTAEQIRNEVIRMLSGPGSHHLGHPWFIVVRKLTGSTEGKPMSIPAHTVNAPNGDVAAKMVAKQEDWYDLPLFVISVALGTVATKLVHRTITVEDAA